MHAGVEFSGKKQHGGGRQTLIDKDPIQVQIVVDVMEYGLGCQSTHVLVNEYRIQLDAESVGLSCVNGTITRLNPIITKVTRRKQGSTDPESAWAKARLNWVT